MVSDRPEVDGYVLLQWWRWQHHRLLSPGAVEIFQEVPLGVGILLSARGSQSCGEWVRHVHREEGRPEGILNLRELIVVSCGNCSVVCI